MPVENPMVLGDQPEPKHWGVDSVGNEIFEGDELIKIDEEIILAEVLSESACEFLIGILGAEVIIVGSDKEAEW
ncbi:YqaI family protein [Priestia abyssalis]|uniref:YqaI family protein n=1 Tax=Priestia abyssalis TaxID=1221450 RepID=UPI0009958375|nr:hypothetical protein [Priestia abyssalis]